MKKKTKVIKKPKTPITTKFEWGPVIVGSVIAGAISIVLLQFGSVIGFSENSPLKYEGNLASWEVIAAGVWFLWIQLLASMVGGYSAGYLHTPTHEYASHENEMHDGLYGLAVWATSTVVIFAVGSIAVAFAGYMSVVHGDGEVTATLTDAEQNKTIIFAFAAGATALVSAVVAWWAATVGGEHRLTGEDLTDCISFK